MSHQRRHVDNYEYRNISSADHQPPARPNSASSDQSVDMLQMYHHPAPPPRPPSARRRRPSSGRRASGVRPPSQSFMSHGGPPEPEPMSHSEEIDFHSRPSSSISSRPSSHLSKYNPLPPIGCISKEVEIESSDWSHSDHVTRSLGRLQMDIHVPSLEDNNEDRILDSTQIMMHEGLKTKTEDSKVNQNNLKTSKSHVSFLGTRRGYDTSNIGNPAPKTKQFSNSDRAIIKTTNTEDEHASEIRSTYHVIASENKGIESPKADKTSVLNVPHLSHTAVSYSELSVSPVPPSETDKKQFTRHNLPPEPGEGENRILLAFKLPDGKRIQHYFRPSDSLEVVLKVVENLCDLDLGHFNLACNSPKKIHSDLQVTLASSGIPDRTLLYLEEKD